MNTLWQDLRYGSRALIKHKGLMVIAILSLALGIGANTAIFSLATAVLLNSLPVKEPTMSRYARLKKAGVLSEDF